MHYLWDLYRGLSSFSPVHKQTQASETDINVINWEMLHKIHQQKDESMIYLYSPGQKFRTFKWDFFLAPLEEIG